VSNPTLFTNNATRQMHKHKQTQQLKMQKQNIYNQVEI